MNNSNTDAMRQNSPTRNISAADVQSLFLVGYRLKKKIENAEKRKVAAPVSNVNFNRRGVADLPLRPVTCRTVRLSAANVPG